MTTGQAGGKELQYKATVGIKGQVVIPSKMRREHGIRPGTTVLFSSVNGTIALQPITDDLISSLPGTLLTTEERKKLRSLFNNFKKSERRSEQIKWG